MSSADMRLEKKTLALLAIPVVIGGWALFRPELLFVNKKVNETLPTVSGQELTILSKGSFASYAHETAGMAEIVQSGGKRYLRLTNFKTSNGPDVRVLLVKGGDATKVEKSAIQLGSLKGTEGDQNYEIPEGTNLDEFQSVNIWCERFAVGFGGATLKAEAPTVSKTTASNGFQLAGFGSVIEVTSGKTAGDARFGGKASIIEDSGKRFVELTFDKVPTGAYTLRLVKKETLAIGDYPANAAAIDLGTLKKGKTRVGISTEIDAWLYRSIAIQDAKTQRILSFVHLRSAQEQIKRLSLA